MPHEAIKMNEQWKQVLLEEFSKPYFVSLTEKIKADHKQGKTIYPTGPHIFKALDLCPFDQVKVVILGQDPYHNPGEAMGLSFSVPHGTKIPPSLKNIFKELHADIGFTIPNHGDLTPWAHQGVLMLNAILTVEANRPSSHKDYGWQHFTDEIIRQLSAKRSNVVFLLWGNFAKQKATLIDDTKHLILTSAHPSPLAGGAFFNNHHFSKTNQYLAENGKEAIDWSLS